jgi:hypothetical protein
MPLNFLKHSALQKIYDFNTTSVSDSVGKNLKVLKIYLMTITIVYPPFGYGIRIIFNFSPELRPILGDFIKRYGNLEAPNRM